MFKIAIAIFASLLIANPALAQQRSADPVCEAVKDRTVRFRQIHLDRYNELVKIANSGRASDRDREEMTAREKIVDETYTWLLYLSNASNNSYTSVCWEYHFKLRQVGY